MKKIAVFLFILSTTFGFSTLGTDFFFCYPANAHRDVSGDPAAHYDGQLILTSSYPTTGTVTNSDGSFTVGFTIPADDVRTVTIDSTYWVHTSETVEDLGFRIQTDNDITAYFLAYREPGATNDMALLFPVPSLGTEYIVMCWRDNVASYLVDAIITTSRYWYLGPSMFTIVATEDGTNVTITPKVSTEGGHPAGVPFSVTLNQYEVYQVYATTPSPVPGDSTTSSWPPAYMADLTGSIVESDKPVSVFGGNMEAICPDSIMAADYLIEQMPPLVAWGTEFCAFPVETRNEWSEDILRILGSEDGTTVTIIDDGGTTTITVDRGEYYDWDGPCRPGWSEIFSGHAPSCSGPTLDSPTFISATAPILVGQYIMGATMTLGEPDWLGIPEYDPLGDPAFMLVPPMEQYSSRYVFLTPTGYNNDFLSVAMPNGYTGTILLDGAAPSYSSPWFAIPGGTHQGARINVEPGSHIIEADTAFMVQMYAFDVNYASYATVAGQNLLHINAIFDATKYCLETPVPTGTSTTYRIVVRHTGGDPSTGVVIADTLAAGFTYSSTPPTVELFGSAFRSSTVEPSAGATELTFGRFGMFEGDSIVITFSVDIAPGVSGIFDNGITISDVDENSFSTIGGTLGSEDDCEVTMCDAMPAFVNCPFPCGEFTSCVDQSIEYIIADTTGTAIDTSRIYFTLDWGSGPYYISEGTYPMNVFSGCLTPACDSVLVTLSGFTYPDGATVTFSLDSAFARDSCKTVY